jgi:hypothetical protein
MNNNEIPKLNLNSSVWGNSYWRILYIIALTYSDNPTNDIKNRTKLFLENLILPCEICQNDYINNSILKYPITDEVVSCRMNLLTWIKNIKNIEREKHNNSLLTELDIYNFFNFFDNINIKDTEYFCCELPLK